MFDELLHAGGRLHFGGFAGFLAAYGRMRMSGLPRHQRRSGR